MVLTVRLKPPPRSVRLPSMVHMQASLVPVLSVPIPIVPRVLLNVSGTNLFCVPHFATLLLLRQYAPLALTPAAAAAEQERLVSFL